MSSSGFDRQVNLGYNLFTKYFGNYTLPELFSKYNDYTEEQFMELYNMIKEYVDKRLSSYKYKTIEINIKNVTTGEVLFHLDKAEFPDSWSERSCNIFASKYFVYGKETSIKQAFTRVISWLAFVGIIYGYFDDSDGLTTAFHRNGRVQYFISSLVDILINQRGTFNSPVWFNVGVKSLCGSAVTSACFINKLDDTLDSILAHNIIKQSIAINGSGSGCDLSVLRSENDILSGGGQPAGPCGFFRMFDSNLGAIKSSGKTRRAAGLVLLRYDHPDIEKFIDLKANEEYKARILRANLEQWDNSFSSESQFSHRGLLFQNINVSIRLDEKFWKYYENNDSYQLYHIKSKVKNGSVKARNILEKIAKAAYECGDPGVQYDDNINVWNPFLESGRTFNASNACSEYQFLDNSACNLATLRLTAYYNKDNNTFIYDRFREDIRVMIKAMDILINNSKYPTRDIADVSFSTRSLGLNFADLGELLFLMGLPYDSDEARSVAALLASFMTGIAYDTSLKLSKELDAFKLFDENAVKKGVRDIIYRHCVPLTLSGRELMTSEELDNYARYGFDLPGTVTIEQNNSVNVVRYDCSIEKRHLSIRSACCLKRELLESLDSNDVVTEYSWDNFYQKTMNIWSELYNYTYNSNDFYTYGFRNSQVTLMAPTGTTSLVLGCSTTGIEPNLSHQYKKHLFDGGVIDFNTSDERIKTAINNFNKIFKTNQYKLDEVGEFHKTSKYSLDDLFATAMGTDGKNVLSPLAHIKMMAAIQPFVSMAISKTVNCSHDTTPEEIMDLYYTAWKYGIKSLSVYRDGSKVAQPLTTNNRKEDKNNKDKGVSIPTDSDDVVNDDPSWCISERYSPMINGRKFYIHFGWHEGRLWEVFIRSSGVGGTVDGSLATIAILVSQLIQQNEIGKAIKTLKKMTFPPNGLVTWPDMEGNSLFKSIISVNSLPNLVGRMMEILIKYREENKLFMKSMSNIDDNPNKPYAYVEEIRCEYCDGPMMKFGSGSHCHRCANCGNEIGSC